MDFSEFGLDEPLLRAVADAGYAAPTPIQCAAIPHVLAGRDLLACAQTGTGKTAAFALPILQRLLRHEQRAAPQSPRSPRSPRSPGALVLTPTRELAVQIGDNFESYARHTRQRTCVVVGGVNLPRQVQALGRPVDVLVATPGRLLDLMQQRAVSFQALRVFVLDECDRMLEMGFIADVRRIVASIPKQRQTLLLSATMPESIRALANSLLTAPANVAVTPVATSAETVAQEVHFVEKIDKRNLLTRLLHDMHDERVLVFTRTKHTAKRVALHLTKVGISASAIHGDKSQSARQRVLDTFKQGTLRALVATDIAARGIDIERLGCVINYDLPNVPEAYVHRIGRTGRAGSTGRALSFCEPSESPQLRNIERLTRTRISVASAPAMDKAPVTAMPSRTPAIPVVDSRDGRHDGGRAPERVDGSSSRAPAARRRRPRRHKANLTARSQER